MQRGVEDVRWPPIFAPPEPRFAPTPMPAATRRLQPLSSRRHRSVGKSVQDVADVVTAESRSTRSPVRFARDSGGCSSSRSRQSGGQSVPARQTPRRSQRPLADDSRAAHLDGASRDVVSLAVEERHVSRFPRFLLGERSGIWPEVSGRQTRLCSDSEPLCGETPSSERQLFVQSGPHATGARDLTPIGRSLNWVARGKCGETRRHVAHQRPHQRRTVRCPSTERSFRRSSREWVRCCQLRASCRRAGPLGGL